MPFRRLVLAIAVVVFGCILGPAVRAQVAPICDAVCEPDPGGSGYHTNTAAARKEPHNARGGSGVFPLAGSESYNYAVPILSLPGRNGLDLNLTLHYNSRVWTVNKSNSTVTFNGDRDFPSYGFRIGFGYMEYNGTDNQYVLTESDGTKRLLKQDSSGVYDSVDGRFIRFYQSQKILRYKSGTTVFYEVFSQSQADFLRPYRIQDTNGNYISISYRTDNWVMGQEISTITDTLGRQVTFHYDSQTHLLTKISHDAPEGTREYLFGWNTNYALKYSFGLTVYNSPANNSTHNVLTVTCTPRSAQN